jgi:hypothetical protein
LLGSPNVLFFDLKFCKILGFSLSEHGEWGTRSLAQRTLEVGYLNFATVWELQAYLHFWLKLQKKFLNFKAKPEFMLFLQISPDLVGKDCDFPQKKDETSTQTVLPAVDASSYPIEGDNL